MEDWKDLDNTTPLDILINMNKYQIQVKVKGEWKTTGAPKENVLRDMQYYKFRYRLKPLKPIVISHQELLALSNYFFNKDMTKEDFEKAYCRPVEIIEE